jgi:hypothetical protein
VRRRSGEDFFRDVPAKFVSPFPNVDSLASAKFNELLALGGTAALGAGDFTRWGAEAFTTALQITEKWRAVYVGDFLTAELEDPRISRFVGSAGSRAIAGLFASVAYPSTTDRLAIIRAASDVGFDVAVNTLSAIPVYGTIAAGILQAGYKLGRVFDAWVGKKGSPPVLPWEEYSKGKDEDLVDLFHSREAQGVDWTPLWSPSFDDTPWQFGTRTGKNESPGGIVFGPVRGKGLAWSSGYGALPNSARVLGHTQTDFSGIAGPANGTSPLRRRAEGPPGGGIKDPIIPWAVEVTQTGDYLPSLGQLALALWQGCLEPGPQMYRIDAGRLRTLWTNCSNNLFETGLASVANASAQLKAGANSVAGPYVQVLASQLIEPYIAVLRTPVPWIIDIKPAQLGLFPSSPRPSAIVHPGIFTVGPVELGNRSTAAWFEEDLPRLAWGWPYDSVPKQDWKRLAVWQGAGSPSGGPLYGLDAKNPTKGYRATPWPFQEVAAARYYKLDSIILPAINLLEARQKETLQRVFAADIQSGRFDPRILVAGYIRPDPVGDLPRYGAFVTSEPMRVLARASREQLLVLIKAGHPAKTRIDVRDVEAIDPPFAARLRAAGVPPVPTAPPDTKDDFAVAPPKEPGVDPQGGVPFGTGHNTYSLLWGRQ